MGRKATKATDNIYYLARNAASQEDETFSSREKTAAKLGIERSRLARIELERIEPYAEEVDVMAYAYKAPQLCTDYCNNICPIGIRKLEEQAKAKEPESIERLVLKFLSSTQSMENISKILVEITQDGRVDNDEIKDLQDVFKAMDTVSANLDAIKMWILTDPKLKPFFSFDGDTLRLNN